MKIIVGKDLGSYIFDASAQTITFSGLPTISLEDVVLITNVTDNLIIYNFAKVGSGGTVASQVLTLDYDTTLMDDADELQILLDIGEPTKDLNLSVNKDIIQNPTPSYFQDVVPLTSVAQNMTTGFVDVGFEIPCASYKTLTLWLTVDINSSVDFRLKFFSKHTSAGTEEYPIGSGKITIHTDNTYVPASASRYFELENDADQLVQVDIDLDNSIPFVQLQASVGTVGATAGQIDNAYYTLGY